MDTFEVYVSLFPSVVGEIVVVKNQWPQPVVAGGAQVVYAPGNLIQYLDLTIPRSGTFSVVNERGVFKRGGIEVGTGKIYGTTYRKGQPITRVGDQPVKLFRANDHVLVDETVSAPVTGDFAFYNLNMASTYYLICFDHELIDYPEARGPLSPSPM